MQAYQENIISQNNGMLVAKIVKMSMEVEIPEAPVDENGVIIDSILVYVLQKSLGQC